MIHTVSHHMKFGAVPDRESYLFNGKAPTDKHERFQNSLHTSDRYLGTFIKDLKKRGFKKKYKVIFSSESAQIKEKGSNEQNVELNIDHCTGRLVHKHYINGKF